MSGYRLVPTFRLARRIANDLHPFPTSFSRSHWKQMMDNHLGMMEKVFDHRMDGPMKCKRRWMEDRFATPSWWNSLDNHATSSVAKRQFGKVDFGDDVKKFELTVDLGELTKLDDVNVNVKLVRNNELQVEAKYEVESPDTGEFHKQFFSKILTLPEQVDVEGLKSMITKEGFLKIEAPLFAVENQASPPTREIPIERSSAAESIANDHGATENQSPSSSDK